MMKPRFMRVLALVFALAVAAAAGAPRPDADDALPALSLEEAVKIASDYVARQHGSSGGSKLPALFRPFISSVRLVGFGSDSPYWEIHWTPRGRLVLDGDFTIGVAMDRSVRVIDPGK